jgi:hypothetical protein
MEQVPEEQKTALTKTFAIVGFTALLIFVVWLAIQLVSIIPGAFSSLASLADSVYNYDKNQELVVSTGNTVVNAGESFTITWTQMRGDGTYAFSYACTEGVALDAKNSVGEVVSLACDTPLDLGTATSLDVLVASEKARFVDIPYTITFTKANDSDNQLSTKKTITIVNVTIPTSGVIVVEDTDTEVVKTPTPVVTTPKPVYVRPKTTTGTKVVYRTPVSNPNGVIDLQISNLKAGTLTSGKIFVASKTIDEDKNGAIQFEIKNIGTKTSGTWSYVAHLPSDITYTSPIQVVLKPQERAIITIGFEGIDKKGTEKFDVKVTATGDFKTSNNSVSSSVKIVD